MDTGSEMGDNEYQVLGIDVHLLYRSKEGQNQRQSVMNVSLGDLASTSFGFEGGGGSFLVCKDISLEDVTKVARISLAVLSRQGRMQSSGRVEYERGLLRLREPSRYTPPNALELPMLLLSHEEFKIKLHDGTTRVHQQSLSSYDAEVTLAVSVYDMSVVPSDALKIGPTGRIIVAGAQQSLDDDGDELPPPPPPEDEDEDEDEEEEEEEEEQWMPTEGGRYHDMEKGDDGEYVETTTPKEEKELQELAALFNVTLKTARRHQEAASEVAEKENSSKRALVNKKDEPKEKKEKKKNLRVSLSLDDVLEQMRLHQEEEKVLRAKAEAATKELPAPTPAHTARTPEKKGEKGTIGTKTPKSKSKDKPKRAPLSAPLSEYVSADTGKVVKRPYLKRGADEARRKTLMARSELTKEQGRAPLARRGAPMKRVAGGSHSDKHKLTIGSKTSRAVIKERNRVSTVRLVQEGKASILPRKPSVPPYREKKDRNQQAREDAMRKYVETANANATASASAWKFKDAGKVDFDAKQQLVATRRSVTTAREQGEPVTAGAGEPRFRGGSEHLQAWRPPVSTKNPEPIIFSRPV
jgi:hypothetical protein